MAKLKIALQMYTVRDDAKQDFIGTLRKVADIGYTAVEISAPAGMTAAVLKKLLDDLGLTPVGTHIPIDALEKELDKNLDYYGELGVSYITCPWLPEDRRKDAAGWKRTAKTLESIGKKIVKGGFTFCYHNHSFEFGRFDGKYGLDILYEESDPSFVQSQLDTYWVQHGGENPADYIRKLSGRVPLVHLKDMLGDGQKTFAEVGEGILDWDGIFQAAQAAGADWYIVEQDRCQRPPMESIRISLNNLKRMGVA
ncbi:MAG: sugar phosphate isomerase/epimerase [Planctomycetota bacterium]